ncbi:MAG: hypothetical protein KBS89_06890, partial [Bacteroidales bacterium]|nr:hypothetical protein [Candidatus Egerieousia equi]
KTYYKGFIQKEGKRTYTWREELILADGWTKEEQPEPNPLEIAKANKLIELAVYDHSSEVNSFLIGDTPKWFTPEERANYLLTLQAAKDKGADMIEYEGRLISTEMAIKTLKDICVYAMECVAVTARHRAKINSFTNVGQVETYNFRTGYPEKVVFESNTGSNVTGGITKKN